MNCLVCEKEISTEHRTGIREYSRRKGFCDVRCLDYATPVDPQDIEKKIRQWTIQQKSSQIESRCFCVVCNSVYARPEDSGIYKNMIMLPGALNGDGHWLIPCGDCL